METSIDRRPVLDEEVWHAWIQKRKLREEATARKLKKLGGIVLDIGAFGAVFYLLLIS
jgi:hypothetical protein